MNATAVLATLEKLGTEQNRKVYRRHGMKDPLFGVSFAHLRALQKKVKTDQALADTLWKSGNADARIFAAMVADPAAMSPANLETWVRGVDCYPVSDAFTGLVARSPHAGAKAEKWSRDKSEWIGRAGWHLYARLILDQAVSDADCAALLKRIAAGIHAAPNRTRDAMNNALIAIGGRGGALEKSALAAAKRIGRVEVDHGETACKTPDARSYILKMKAHHEKLAARRAAQPAARSKPVKASTRMRAR